MRLITQPSLRTTARPCSRLPLLIIITLAVALLPLRADAGPVPDGPYLSYYVYTTEATFQGGELDVYGCIDETPEYCNPDYNPELVAPKWAEGYNTTVDQLITMEYPGYILHVQPSDNATTILDTDWSEMCTVGSKFKDTKPQLPIRYWTLANENCAAGSSSDGSLRGTFGAGFNVNGTSWLDAGSIACNTSLPVLCSCRSNAPIPNVNYRELAFEGRVGGWNLNGTIAVLFSSATNMGGMNVLATRPCSDLLSKFQTSDDGETFVDVPLLGFSCMFTDPFTLNIIPSRLSPVKASSSIVFKFPSPIKDAKGITAGLNEALILGLSYPWPVGGIEADYYPLFDYEGWQILPPLVDFPIGTNGLWPGVFDDVSTLPAFHDCMSVVTFTYDLGNTLLGFPPADVVVTVDYGANSSYFNSESTTDITSVVGATLNPLKQTLSMNIRNIYGNVTNSSNGLYRLRLTLTNQVGHVEASPDFMFTVQFTAEGYPPIATVTLPDRNWAAYAMSYEGFGYDIYSNPFYFGDPVKFKPSVDLQCFPNIASQPIQFKAQVVNDEYQEGDCESSSQPCEPSGEGSVYDMGSKTGSPDFVVPGYTLEGSVIPGEYAYYWIEFSVIYGPETPLAQIAVPFGVQDYNKLAFVYNAPVVVVAGQDFTIDVSKTCDPDLDMANCSFAQGLLPGRTSSLVLGMTCDVCQYNGEEEGWNCNLEEPCFAFPTSSPTNIPSASPGAPPTAYPTTPPFDASNPPTASPTVQSPNEWWSFTPVESRKWTVSKNVNNFGTRHLRITLARAVAGRQITRRVLSEDLPKYLDSTDNYYTYFYIDVVNDRTAVCGSIPSIAAPPDLAGYTKFSNPKLVTLPPDGPFVISADVQPIGAKVKWYMQRSDEPSLYPVPASVSAVNTIGTLVIKSNSLIPGAIYQFTLTSIPLSLTATPACPVASISVVIQVNSPPTGGALSISPSSGTSTLDDFVLEATGFTDIDALPGSSLSYRFYILPSGKNYPIPLTADWSTSSILVTKLVGGITPTGNRVIVRCRDALGAVSQDVWTSSFTLLPLYDPTTTTNLSTLPTPEDLLKKIAENGVSTNDALKMFQDLGNAASYSKDASSNASAADQLFLKNWRTSIGTAALNLLNQVASTIDPSSVSLDQVDLMVGTLTSAVQINGVYLPGTLLNATDLTKTLIENALEAAENAGLSTDVTQYIPDSMGASLIDILSGLAKGIQVAEMELAAKQNGGRRLLEMLEAGAAGRRSLLESLGIDCQADPDLASCQALTRIRQYIKKMVGTLMHNYLPGATQRTIQGVDAEIVISRNYRELVGDLDGNGVSNLTLGTSSNSSDGGPGGVVPSFSLPPSLLSDVSKLRGNFDPNALPDTIDVVAVRFRFNVRELIATGNAPPGVNISADNITVDGVVIPNYTIPEVFSLMFLSPDNPENTTIDPYNLTQEIIIEIPLPAGYELPTDNTTQALSCGAWDEDFGGWSAAGCRVVSYDIPNLKMTCACNHASDYAAWNAFVSNLGGSVGVVATIAVIVVGILLPGILIFWGLIVYWGHVQDKHQANLVHLGALILLTRNRLGMRRKQRRFFQLLRDNARAPVKLMVDSDAIATAEQEKASLLAQARAEAAGKKWYYRYLPHSLARFVRAVLYDHSVIGLFTRFDPYYSRVQRATVFVTILIGNLFAASFFFDLKTANDVTFGFLVGTVILASLTVSIPVKIVVRWLFRATDAATGSTLDRVSHIYRVIAMHNDFLPIGSEAEEKDIAMLAAFKNFYAVKVDLKALKVLADEAERLEAAKAKTAQLEGDGEGNNKRKTLVGAARRIVISSRGASSSSSWGVFSQCLAMCGMGKTQMQPSEKARVKSMAVRVGLKVREFDDAGNEVRDDASPPSSATPARVAAASARGGGAQMMEVDGADVMAALARTQKLFEQRKAELREACEEAHDAWKTVPRRANMRVETLRKQQSSVMRFAALLYDDVGDRARERGKSCGPQTIYLAWAVVLCYLLGGLAYVAYWVISRTSYKGGFTSTPTDAELSTNANAIIVTWLISAFVGVGIGIFLIEPGIQFIRFTIVPWVLERYGRGFVRADGTGRISEADVGKSQLMHQLSINAKAEVFDNLEKQKKDKREGNAREVVVHGAFEALGDLVEALA